MLFPSTLVVSSDITTINPQLTELGHASIINNPDIYTVTEYSIENIRSLSHFLSITPYNHTTKIVIIPEAHLLNLESQNTLLKNLEEPGEGNYFILLTTRPNSLISTILSRCHTIKPQSIKNSHSNILIKPKTISECLLLSESLPKDKIEFSDYLQDQIQLYQQQLVKNPTPHNHAFILKLIKATQMLSANVDPKSVADFLLLS